MRVPDHSDFRDHGAWTPLYQNVESGKRQGLPEGKQSCIDFGRNLAAPWFESTFGLKPMHRPINVILHVQPRRYSPAAGIGAGPDAAWARHARQRALMRAMPR